MKKYILSIILAFTVCGCATLTQPGAPFYRIGQQRKLARAVKLLEQEKLSAATELLAAVSAEPGVAGINDEALFRLSLLHLGSGRETTGMAQAQNDLELLVKGYPASSWVPLASGLTELIAVLDGTQDEGRMLKDANFSLTQENRELKGLNLALVKDQKALKESNSSLIKELRTLKELNISLTEENRELHQNIEKLKSLEMELGKETKSRKLR